MPFAAELFRYRSVAFVGTGKNTGKTEALNYFLHRARDYGKKLTVTSIGIDGESVDQVTQTAKPEITLFEGTRFITSEAFYAKRRIVSQIVGVSEATTSLGRLVTATALGTGKVLLAGPADTFTLKRLIDAADPGELFVVDGALSRLSPASPAVTESLVLCTGAALSHRIDEIVAKTMFLIQLIQTPKWEGDCAEELQRMTHTVCAVTADGVVDLGIPSVFGIEQSKDRLFDHGTTLFFSGAVTDPLFEFLIKQRCVEDITLIVRDFTKLFVSQRNYTRFVNRGGTIRVLDRSRLVAVCVNPVSPKGFRIDSAQLLAGFRDAGIPVPVYDVRETDHETER